MARTKRSSQQKLPPATNPEGVKSVYSNTMELRVGGMDARLFFNEIIPDGDSLRVERRASIVMPLGHFRAMVKVFNENLPKALEAARVLEKSLAAARDEPKA
jgi:hypothetical protein